MGLKISIFQGIFAPKRALLGLGSGEGCGVGSGVGCGEGSGEGCGFGRLVGSGEGTGVGLLMGFTRGYQFATTRTEPGVYETPGESGCVS